MFIGRKARKLLKDLNNPDLWENTSGCVKHKEHKFEVWHSAAHEYMIYKTKIEFNLIEKILIARKVRKMKRKLKEIENKKAYIPPYFR